MSIASAAFKRRAAIRQPLTGVASEANNAATTNNIRLRSQRQ